MSSIFGDLDMNNVADDPWSVNDGTYVFDLTECKAGPTSKGDKKGMTFTWTVTESDDDPAMMGRKFTEWLEIPVPADPNNMTPEESAKASRLKSRILSLGVPHDRVNSVTTGELLGTRAVIRLGTTSKNGNDYQNIKDLKLKDSDLSGVSDNPFAGSNLG
jgi:hypothetical protein